MTATSIRNLSIALTLIAILVLAAHFFEYLRYAIAAIFYRFEIFDAEGIVWQQAMLIPGPRMYGDIHSYPFIVFHYPPLYHLSVRAISLLGFSPLLVGRAISVAATLASAVTIAILTWRLVRAETGRLAALMSSAVSGLAFLCFFPVVATSPLMRVDMMAVAFSFMGLLFFTTSKIQSWRPFVGMIFFVLAIFTKQTSIAAPMAAIAVMGLIAPRYTVAILGFGLLLGAVPLAILMWMTNGGFLRHLVIYNINRYSLSLAWASIESQAAHLIFLTLAVIAIVLWWRKLLSNHRDRSPVAWRDTLTSDVNVRAMVMVMLYLGVSTLMLAGLGKSGATLAYFDEWAGLLCIMIGALFATIVAPSDANGGMRLANSVRLLAPVLLIIQVMILPSKLNIDFSDEKQARESDELVGRIASAEKPVLSADMVMLMLAGKEVPWEPAIFTELAAIGRWDETLIIRMIAAHEFAFIVTRDSMNFSPSVASAVNAAYPRIEKTAAHTLHLPPE